MAPSTPPPPSNVSFAALTMASTSSVVMSPCQTRARIALLRHKHPRVALHRHCLRGGEREVVLAEIDIHALPANAGPGVLREHHARHRLPIHDRARVVDVR